jgi:hypothetical protein
LTRLRTVPARLAPLSYPVAVLLVAWALHWHTFGLTELGQDGFLSVDLAWGSLPAMLAFTARDVHPPLFFALLHWWFALTGVHDVTAKYLPIAGSMLSLALLYGIGVRLVGKAVAALAIALYLFSASSLLLAPTVRPFTLALCCSLLTLRLALAGEAAVTAADRYVHWCALAFSTALALLAWYLQPFFLVLEAMLIWRATPPGQASAASRGLRLSALAGGCLLAAPWYVYVLPLLWAKLQAGGNASGGVPALPTFMVAASGLAKGVSGAASWPLSAFAVGGWVVALALGCGSCAGGRGGRGLDATSRSPGASPRPPRATEATAVRAEDVRAAKPAAPSAARFALLTGLFLGSGELLVILLRWQHPDAFGRYLLGLLPFIVLLQSVAALRSVPAIRLLAAGGLVLALLGQLAWFTGLLRSTPINWESDPVFASLAPQLRTGDGLLFSDRARRAQYELNALYFRPLPAAVIQTSGDAYLGATPEQAAQTVADLRAQVSRIWYLESAELTSTPKVGRAALARHAYIAASTQVDDTSIQLFLTQRPTVQRQFGVTLGQAASLQSATYSSVAPPGGAITVRLLWRAEQVFSQSYTVFVHLDSTAGKLAAQHDGVPAAGLQPTNTWQPGELIDDRHAILLPPDLAPGAYRLDVGLYRGQQRLALPDGTNQLTIATVRIGA